MATPAIEIHPSAVNEARKAYRWYHHRSAQAASRFQAALEGAIEQIAQSPDLAPLFARHLLSTAPSFSIHWGLSAIAGPCADRRRRAWQTKTWLLEAA